MSSTRLCQSPPVGAMSRAADDCLDRRPAGPSSRQRGLHATAVLYLPALHAVLIGFADQAAVALPVGNYPCLAALSRAELEHLAIGLGGTTLWLEELGLQIPIADLIAASRPLMDMAATVVGAQS